MRNSLSARIADTLAREIDDGAFGTDRRFPTERDLARRFDVARNTVRRAMDILEDSGKIARHVGRGTFVTGGRNTPVDPAMGVDGGSAVDVSDISPRELIEARMTIEPAVAAMAAANATDSDIERLVNTQAASGDTDIMEEFEHHDAELHRLLFATTHNRLVQRIDDTLSAMRQNADWLAAKRNAYSDELKARYIEQHGEIIDAIRRRSPAAARAAMKNHLEEVRRALLEEG